MAQKAGIILYDFLAFLGGAERLILTLAQALEGVDLCVGYRKPFQAVDEKLAGICCRDLGAESQVPAWRTVKLIRAFETRAGFVSEYDWALFNGLADPVAVRHRPGGRNYLYCHSIPRLAYDLRAYYMAQVPVWQRPALAALARYLRRKYEAAIGQMDVVMANSENVKKRIKRYLGLESEVVHPPCDTQLFRWLGQDDYYLSTARLDGYKRVELIVRAFLRMPQKKLVVTSGGPELERLKALAENAPNIRFTGWVSESMLQQLVGKAISTLYVPVEEDFGMSPVESMAAGKPVIGVAEGGLLETVVHGETGILLRPDPSQEDLIEAVESLDARKARSMREACEARARVFRTEVFVERMRGILRH